MRIVMLSQFFYPPTVGGEERHVADLSHELAARGHKVSVVTLWQPGYPTWERDQGGVCIHRIRSTTQRLSCLYSDRDRPCLPPFPDPEVMLALRRIISQERPEIVHAHDWIVHSLTPLKQWSQAKLVVSLHNYGQVCVQQRLMREQMRCSGPGWRKCLDCATRFYGPLKGPPSMLAHRFWAEKERQNVDMFLPVSQAVVEGTRLNRYRMPYRIIPNFIPDTVDIASEDSNPLLAQLPEQDFLLFVGDVTQDKGARTLLEAYKGIETSVPLVLIGRPLLEEVCGPLPPGIFSMGRWPHDAVMGAWKRSLIGLVPSIVSETFGIVTLEAMRMGKPVIASHIGGLPDIVKEGETGRLVPPGDVEALRGALRELLSDEQSRERMGTRARQEVEAFLASSVVTRIEQLYHDLLEEDAFDTGPRVQIGTR